MLYNLEGLDSLAEVGGTMAINYNDNLQDCKQKVTMHKKWQIRVHRKQQLRVHSFPFFQKYNKFKERVNFDISFDR